jgi:anti-sigma regulatory factor (Ser/Thr protein kinase)
MYEGEINMVIHACGGVVDVEIDSACISVTLKDTGPGIEDIDLAMKEGYSTASEKVRSMGFGAGMGLSNMRKHSDYMKIESAPGVGTTVYIKIAIGEDLSA